MRRLPVSSLGRRQRGVMLLQASIVLMLALLGSVWAGSRLMRDAADAQAEATGTYLLAIKGALDAAIAANFHAYANGSEVADASGTPRFADATAPTLSELRNLGHLPPGFADTTPAGQAVQIRIRRDAVRCPGVGCRIDGLVHTRTPFRQPFSGGPDFEAAALAVQAMQGWGAAAWQAEPGQLRGPAFTRDNPEGTTGGIVGILAMLDTSMWSQFVRIGDDRDPALQGNLSVQGSGSIQRIGIRESVVPNSACAITDFANPSLPPGLRVDLIENVEYARTASGGLAACVEGRWRAVATVASIGEVCGNTAHPEGMTATDVSGIALLCRDGTWSYMSQWLSRHVRMAAYLIPQTLTNAQTNNTVPKPVCGTSGGVAGTPNVQMIPQSIQNRGSFALNGVRSGDTITVTGTMTLDPTNFPTSVSGTNWLVRVPPNSQALVETYCTYM